MYFVTRVISLVTSVIGLVIVIACICTQPIMSLFFGNIPSSLAWILSFTASLLMPLGYFIIYAPICIACGIIGSPLSIMKTVLSFLFSKSNTTKESWKKKFGKLLGMIKGLVVKTLWEIFRIIFIVPIAILDTIIGSVILNDERKKESWLWNLVFPLESEFYDYKDVYGENFDEKYNKEELWIHINGILTGRGVAKGNCKKMRELFGQPFKLMHNPTDGPVLDIMECIIGKSGLLKHGTTKPRDELRNILLKEMKKDYKKIVLVAHSQGTIITGNVIADLTDAANNDIDDISWFDRDSIWFDEDDDDETMERKSAELKKTLEKLEVYLFAGCAHHVDGAYVNRLECLSNRGDLVAILGHLFPTILKPFWKNTRGNGIVYKKNKSYIEKSSWGHLLLSHYLRQFEEGLFSSSKLSKEYLQSSEKEKTA